MVTKGFATSSKTSAKSNYIPIDPNVEYENDTLIFVFNSNDIDTVRQYKDSIICIEVWSNNKSYTEDFKIEDVIKDKRIEIIFSSSGHRYYEIFGYDEQSAVKQYSTGVNALLEDCLDTKGGDGDEKGQGKSPPFAIKVKPDQSIPWSYEIEYAHKYFIIHVNSDQFEALINNTSGLGKLLSLDFIRAALIKCAYHYVYIHDFRSTELEKHFLNIVKVLEQFVQSPIQTEDYEEEEDSSKYELWLSWIDESLGNYFNSSFKQEFTNYLNERSGIDNDE